MDKSTLTPQRYALLHAAASLSLDDRLGTIREPSWIACAFP